SSRRFSSAATVLLAADAGKRRATLWGPSVSSVAHENARSTCGSSAALPFGRHTTTRGAAVAGARGTVAAAGAAAGSPTSGTTGLAGAAASRVTAKVAKPLIAAPAEAKPRPTSEPALGIEPRTYALR